MDIWFKAKVDWGEALGLLSDTEAGGSPRRYGNTPPRARPARSRGASRCSSRWCWPTSGARPNTASASPPCAARPAGAAAVPRGKQNKQRLIPQSRRKQPKRDRIQKREGQNPDERARGGVRGGRRGRLHAGDHPAAERRIGMAGGRRSGPSVARALSRRGRGAGAAQHARLAAGQPDPAPRPRAGSSASPRRGWRGSRTGEAGLAADLAGVLVAGVPGVLGVAALAVPEGLAEVAAGLAVAADLAAARGMRGGRNGFRSRCTGSGRTIRRSSGSYRRNSWNG